MSLITLVSETRLLSSFSGAWRIASIALVHTSMVSLLGACGIIGQQNDDESKPTSQSGEDASSNRDATEKTAETEVERSKDEAEDSKENTQHANESDSGATSAGVELSFIDQYPSKSAMPINDTAGATLFIGQLRTPQKLITQKIVNSATETITGDISSSHFLSGVLSQEKSPQVFITRWIDRTDSSCTVQLLHVRYTNQDPAESVIESLETSPCIGEAYQVSASLAPGGYLDIVYRHRHLKTFADGFKFATNRSGTWVKSEILGSSLRNPSIAVGPNNETYIAFGDPALNRTSFGVFDGNQWKFLDVPNVSSHQYQSVLIDPTDNRPIVLTPKDGKVGNGLTITISKWKDQVWKHENFNLPAKVLWFEGARAPLIDSKGNLYLLETDYKKENIIVYRRNRTSGQVVSIAWKDAFNSRVNWAKGSDDTIHFGYYLRAGDKDTLYYGNISEVSSTLQRGNIQAVMIPGTKSYLQEAFILAQ